MKTRRNFLILAGFLFCFPIFSSCALFLVGGGIAGGIAISEDTIEGNVDKSLDPVWNAAREVIMSEGFIRIEDKPHGIIEAEVRKSQVNLDIRKITEKTVRIQVKARKGYKLIPDLDLANDLYNKINAKL